MKILFVLDYFFPYTGGSEILFKNLAEGLVKKGHSVDVITKRVIDSNNFEDINGVRVRRLWTPSILPRFFFMLFVFPYLILNAKKYDLLHTTSCGSSISAWFVSKLCRIPSVITVHEVIEKNWKQFYNLGFLSSLSYRLMEAIMLKLPHKKHICVSRSTKKGLVELGVPKKKITVVHNALDYGHWNEKKHKGSRQKIRDKLGINKNEFLYVFYGRPGISKGVEYLIKAIPEISKNIPNSKALFVMGKEPSDRYNLMKSLLKKYGKGNVILHKPVGYSELPKYIMAADCVVVPSITEGFGFCVAESCAMGRPVVASNTTSIPEVASGKFLLVPPKNSSAIAKALLMVKQRKYMKTSLKKFTLENFLDGYEAVYEKLVKFSK